MSIACESHMFDTEIDRGESPPDDDEVEEPDRVERDPHVDDMDEDDIRFPEPKTTND